MENPCIKEKLVQIEFCSTSELMNPIYGTEYNMGKCVSSKLIYYQCLIKDKNGSDLSDGQ